MPEPRNALLAALTQVAAMVGLVVACFQLFANWVDAKIAFMGDVAVVEPLHVRQYLLWLMAGGVAVVAAAVAGWFRGRWTVPVVLAVMLAGSAVLFHVALPEPAPTTPEGRTGNPNACFSGSNDCPGG